MTDSNTGVSVLPDHLIEAEKDQLDFSFYRNTYFDLAAFDDADQKSVGMLGRYSRYLLLMEQTPKFSLNLIPILGPTNFQRLSQQ